METPSLSNNDVASNDVTEQTGSHPPKLINQDYEPLATSLQPLTSATLTVRVIKSFEYRTQKALVLRELNLEVMTVIELMERCRAGEPGRRRLGMEWNGNADRFMG